MKKFVKKPCVFCKKLTLNTHQKKSVCETCQPTLFDAIRIYLHVENYI